MGEAAVASPKNVIKSIKGDDVMPLKMKIRCTCGHIHEAGKDERVTCACGNTVYWTTRKHGNCQPWVEVPDGVDIASLRYKKPEPLGWVGEQ